MKDWAKQGSPPPMRGKAKRRIHLLGAPGITPAHAGKSTAAGVGASHDWDHPRPCGEKPLMISTGSSMSGSPPPMRGKATSYRRFNSQNGITPAHARKSWPYLAYIAYR